MPEEYVMTSEQLDEFVARRVEPIVKRLEDALDDAMRFESIHTNEIRKAYKSAIEIVKRLL